MIKILSVAACMVFGACAAAAQQTADSIAPEAASPAEAFPGMSDAARASFAARAAGVPVRAHDWMVVAANPLAVEAGAEVLAAGGSAADAMVAVQAVLGLVEPQSSGLGGGAFLVWFDAATQRVTTLDGRETAPMAARPTLFQDDDGVPLRFFDAVVGGRSVGVPGTPALMEAAHRRWGRLAWGGLFDAAITYADTGFPVSPRLASLVADGAEHLQRFPATEAYFFPGGGAISAGDTLRNPAFTDTLRAMARDGARVMYSGRIAEEIVATVRAAEGNPGLLAMADLAGYAVVERPAVCVDYRAYDVCGMGPPSSGGLTVGQILGMLDGYDLASLGPDNAQSWRLIGDASRLAFADRGRYMADSDYVPMPTNGLVDPAYLAARGALLGGEMALPDVAPGTPVWDHAWNLADDISLELPSTSHISIVDAYGNALSMTTTIENAFGSRLMTPGGFLLNNELTDFSFRTHVDGLPIANRLEPGKRPRSSMSPTLVLRDGAPVLVIGSPGGSQIIGYVAQSIIAHLDWGMDVQQAVSMPRAVNRFGAFELEEGTNAEALAEPLAALGYEVTLRSLTSGLHAIAIRSDGLEGGADPRREGIALGR